VVVAAGDPLLAKDHNALEAMEVVLVDLVELVAELV
jgi:hypothetical protein